MVTALRAHGLRVVIFVNDHPPAHVHVFGDGEAKINLRGADDGPPELVWAEAMSRSRSAGPCASWSSNKRSCWPAEGDPWLS